MLSRQAKLDFLVIATLCAVFYLFAIQYDAFEALAEWVERHEEYELDEFILLLPFLVLGLAVFSVRRVVELRREIHLRDKAEQKLHHVAYHDALTGLANRTYFNEYLHQELVRCRRDGTAVAVLAVDLLKFKQVNENLGHRAGDTVLRNTSTLLKTCIREIDMVARLDGDEFCIIQVGLDQPDQAAKLAQRILNHLVAPMKLQEGKITVNASIGVTVSRPGVEEANGLLREADIAMHRAKTEGYSTFRFFEPEMDETLRKRYALERDLRKAVERGELELHFQPVFGLPEPKLVGFEALLRWRHPKRGMISPMEFIPIAEETGLIHDLGAFLLDQACGKISALPANLKVAVNVSPQQFSHGDLVANVRQTLARTGLPAGRLELEITENILMQDTVATVQTLHKLKAMGVGIAMDDFGIGYSSLSYLRSFPFDRIKIDRSFIRDLKTNADGRTILRAIVALSKSLGMRTTAEGVEDEQQLSIVVGEGCEEVQGFLLGRPMPFAELRKLPELVDLSH